jgi:hypothetical protein
VAFGIVRTVQLAATLVIAGPIGMVGLFSLLETQYTRGVFFLGAAVGLVVVSEYVYVRLTDRTVGRVKRLKNIRGGSE